MHVYKELTQPTTVTHSLTSKFLDKNEDCLVVVRGNSLLEFYTILDTYVEVLGEKEEHDDDNAAQESAMLEHSNSDSFIAEGLSLEQSKEERTSKLIFQSQWPLDGFVTDIHKVSTIAGDDGRECLLISFQHAKMSLVKWNNNNQRVSTISIHYYEKDLDDLHFADQGFQSYFRVDPQNNCACMMYQRDQLAFLPFVQEQWLEDNQVVDDSVSQSSFLIHASKLDESLTNIIDYTFLHEYKEPTMAIVYQSQRTWTGLLPLANHKDTTRYMVLSLDLQQRSSTAITSITGLPHDVTQVLPLQNPLSGTMLVTPNVLIHIDNAGKTTSVGLNSLAKQTTDMNLIDQSDLELRLEGCKLVQVDESNGEFLLILTTGELCNVKFKIEGRRVYGFTVSRLNNKQQDWAPRPSCTTVLSKNRNIFVGSFGGAACLYTWRRKGEKNTVDNGKVSVVKSEEEEKQKEKEKGDDDGDELDDLYGDSDEVDSSNTGAFVVAVDDRLMNYGPMISMAIAKPRITPRKLRYGDPRTRGFDIVCATGAGVQGSLSIFQQHLRPNVISDLKLQTTEKIWSLCTRTNVTDSDLLYDNFVVTSDETGSTIYKLQDKQLRNVTSSCAFDSSSTVGIGSVTKGSAVVQVTLKYALTYDAEFKAAGKKVKFENEKQAVYVSIQDPYILVTMDDGSTMLLHASKTPKAGKPTIEVVKHGSSNASTTLNGAAACGSLSTSRIFAQLPFESRKRKRDEKKKKEEEIIENNHESVVASYITNDGELEMYKVTDVEQRVVFKKLNLLPGVLGEDEKYEDCSINTTKVEFKQVVFKGIGDSIDKEEYLFLLTSTDEVYIYKAYLVNEKLKFCKLPNTIAAKQRGEQDVRFEIINIGDYTGICITGSLPQLILKSHKTPIRIQSFAQNGILGATSFNTDAVYKGFLTVDELGVVRICTLTNGWDYTSASFISKQVRIGSSISKLCYHEQGRVFAISTNEPMDYNYVDEDEEPIEGLQEGVIKGQSFKSTLKLVSPLTWTVIDSKEMDEDNEAIMSLQSVVLTTNEKANRKKEVFAVGTSILRGEDLAAKGTFYLFDAVDIVPEPGKPETDRRLKELARESVKGAVTSICEVDGHLLVAQDQKVVIRNLQEDNSIIPVAFLDLNMYIVDSKSIKNFVLVGDAMTSVWLAGFGQEPYRMNTMGKDLRKIKVTSTEFIISSGRLYIVACDTERVMHILQYEPENPSSLAGQRLLPKSDYYIGRFNQTMVLIPSNEDQQEEEEEEVEAEEELVPLMGSNCGVISTVLPISESTMRTMFVVQQQIIDKDDHTACLNPRMHRDLAAYEYGQQRTNVLDFNVIRRFVTLDVEKKFQFSRKVGKNGQDGVWDSIKDLELQLDYL